MNPFYLIGRTFSDVEETLDHSGIEPVCDDLEEGEKLHDSVSAVDCSWEISLGENGLIETIFIHNPDKLANYTGISSTSTNAELEHRFGEPSSSGPQQEVELFGKYGCWERYDKDGYSLHVQHEVDSGVIELATFHLKVLNGHE